MKTNKPSKGGRPSKYKEIEKQLPAIILLYEKGCIDAEVAKAIGICEKTLNNYKNEHPEFLQPIKEAKEIENNKVIDSLLKRAHGFEYTEEHQEGIKQDEYDKDGKVIGFKVIPSKVKKIKKMFPPETAACIFWLCNRDRANWQQRQSMEHGINSSISDLIKKANANPTGITDSKTDS